MVPRKTASNNDTMTKSRAPEYIAPPGVEWTVCANSLVEAASGTYALVLRCPRRVTLAVGALGQLTLRRGHYLYVGSAFGPGGVLARVQRHLRETKPRHWHVDYLTPVAVPIEVWYCHDREPREHGWAGALHADPRLDAPAPGFGASDCRCHSHLFFARAHPRLEAFRPRLSGQVRRVDAHALCAPEPGR